MRSRHFDSTSMQPRTRWCESQSLRIENACSNMWWLMNICHQTSLHHVMLSIELGTGYMCTILSKKPSAFTCKRFAPTLLRHPLSELLSLQHFEFEPHRRTFHWFVWCHVLKSNEAFMPACSTDQISRLKRIIKMFENDQKDSAEASVGSVVKLKAWQQAKAFEAQNLFENFWTIFCEFLWLWLSGVLKPSCRRIATLAGCSASQLLFFDNEPGVQGV